MATPYKLGMAESPLDSLFSFRAGAPGAFHACVAALPRRHATSRVWPSRLPRRLHGDACQVGDRLARRAPLRLVGSGCLPPGARRGRRAVTPAPRRHDGQIQQFLRSVLLRCNLLRLSFSFSPFLVSQTWLSFNLARSRSSARLWGHCSTPAPPRENMTGAPGCLVSLPTRSNAIWGRAAVARWPSPTPGEIISSWLEFLRKISWIEMFTYLSLE